MECKLRRNVLDGQTFPWMLLYISATCSGTFCSTSSQGHTFQSAPLQCQTFKSFRVWGVDWRACLFFRLLLRILLHELSWADRVSVIMSTPADNTNSLTAKTDSSVPFRPSLKLPRLLHTSLICRRINDSQVKARTTSWPRINSCKSASSKSFHWRLEYLSNFF